MPTVNNSSTPRRQWRCRWSDTRPSRREGAILRRLGARGGLVVTYGGGGLHFACGDGTSTGCNGFRALGYSDFEKFTELNWLRPDPGAPALFAECVAQRYTVEWRP
jgi:hypothetical protein